MSNLLSPTRKLYYEDPSRRTCEAMITQLSDDAICLNQTVAYPEGGGQEADTGLMDTPVGTLRFTDVRKRYGTKVETPGYTGVNAGGIIFHFIHPDDLHLLSQLSTGLGVTLTIDAQRRERLSTSHSASHFLYAAVLKVRPELKGWTLGCHIREDAARFDFLVEDGFTPSDLAAIQTYANFLISLGLPIEGGHIEDYPDARFWKYGDIVIPCGGTHLTSVAAIGELIVKRKRLGKNKERLTCTFAQALATPTAQSSER